MFKAYILKLGLGILAVAWTGIYFGGFVLPEEQKFSIGSEKSIDPLSLGVYVINLDSSKERWKRIHHHLSQFSFSVHRISGVYGKAHPQLRYIPSVVDLERYRLLLKGKEPGLGEIGCYLSHAKALRTFLHSRFEFALIVEDDVSFSPIFSQVIRGLLNCKEKWDLCSFELHPLQSGWPLFISSSSLSLPIGSHLCVYFKESWRAGAYLINRWAAQRLLEKSLPMCLPWDMYYMRFWEFKDSKGKAMKFMGIEPRCAFQTFGDSDIERAGPRQIAPAHRCSKYRWYGRYFALCSHVSRFFYGLWNWVRVEWID